jgi:hypothetical protein
MLSQCADNCQFNRQLCYAFLDILQKLYIFITIIHLKFTQSVINFDIHDAIKLLHLKIILYSVSYLPTRVQAYIPRSSLFR